MRYSFPYIPEGVYGELRIADKLKDDITKQIISIKNKIHRWLSIYFPEYEKIYSSIDTKSGFLILKETPKFIFTVELSKVYNYYKNASQILKKMKKKLNN